MLLRENANYLKIQNTKAWKEAESEEKRNNRKTKNKTKTNKHAEVLVCLGLDAFKASFRDDFGLVLWTLSAYTYTHKTHPHIHIVTYSLCELCDVTRNNK